MTKNLLRIGTAAAAAGLLAVAAQGQEEEAASSADTFDIPDNISILNQSNADLRRATATVNGTIITGTEVDQRVALILAANDAVPSPEELQRLRLQIFRNLIDETLQIQEAAALEMEVSPEEVDETFTRLAADRFGGSIDRIEAYLTSIGSSPASLKRQIEGEIATDRLKRRNVYPFVNVSSEEVNELYERIVAARGTAEYRVGEIYLSANPTTQQAVGENARRIVEQIRQGGNFVAYARQFSEASTAAVGGDLGWIRLQQLQNPTLESAVQELQPGQLVGPVEIPGGFSILYLIDRRQIGMADPRDAVVTLKQISIDFAPGTSEADARVRASAFAEGVEGISDCGQVEAAAAQLGAQVVANEIAVKELPEAIQNPILQLTVGQYFGPFGSLDDGIRVLMLCGREDPETDAGPDRDQLLTQIEDDRINKRWQRYLRDLRRDAVIDYN